MEYRNLEITLISAEGLKDINMVGKMDVYAVAYLVGKKETKQKTEVDKNCGTKPKWNQRMKFTLEEGSLASPPGGGEGVSLVVQIMAEKFGPDKDIGEVKLNVLELFESVKKAEKDGEKSEGGEKDEKEKSEGGEKEKMCEYQIQGKGKGTLKISYKFGEKFSTPTPDVKSKETDQPVLAYPTSGNGGYGQAGSSMPPQHVAYPPNQGYPMGGPPPPQHPGYPPNQGYETAPQPGYYPQQPPPQYGYPGYGAPPPQGYGGPPPPQGYGGYYPPPQGGYGPPPPQPYGYGGYNQQVPEKKKKKGMGMGMGMGMGLGAGLLGGMLIGDMVGDAGDSMDDAGGFDF